MGIFWDLLQQDEIEKQQKQADSLDDRVEILEKELEKTQVLLKKTLVELEKVKQTDWMDLKTEALDFNSEFIWLDDYPFEAEKKVLNKYNRIDALIVVDLKRESELRELRMKIEQLSNNSAYKK